MDTNIPHSVAARYATALADNQTDDVLALLAGSARFQSPFTLWDTPVGVRAAYTARASAFNDFVVRHVLEDHERAMVLWHATVAGQDVEGCEVLTMSAWAAGTVGSVDVYLRPATVLPTVHAAMTVAWPR